jgi:hypothetical protein
MQDLLDRLFLDHPRSVDESYFEHFRFALGFGGTLVLAGLAAITHAFLPFLCETTASRTVKRLHARIAQRGRAPAASPDQAIETDLEALCPQI